MKKSEILLNRLFIAGIFLILAIPLVLSQNHSSGDTNNVNIKETNEAIDKAYQCLQNQIKGKSLSLQEAVFTVLALGEDKSAINIIEKEKEGDCWPKGGCKIKETAQVILAYDRIGKNNAAAVKWLLSKNGSATDLIWYLEVDIVNHIPASCTLKYDGNEKNINVLTDMRLEGNPGSCFSISSSGYWLVVKENCFDKEFEISCDQDFITSLIYEKKSGGGTIYVSAETNSRSAQGISNERVNSQCFKAGNICDYEGSLWASLALSKIGKEINNFMPYVFALADQNKKYFPATFLYSLSSSEDQYSEIVQSQKQGRIWEIVGSPYGKFYDSSLALLALQKTSSPEIDNLKSYLFTIQTKEGCWNNNNIRDTAFLLYSGWEKKIEITGGKSAPNCESISTQSCELRTSCLDIGGQILSNFNCPGINVCCSEKVEVPRCLEQKGTNLCSESQDCDGKSVPSSDKGACCLGECISPPSEDVCTTSGGECRSSCDVEVEKEDKDKSCSDTEKVCCVKIEEPIKESNLTLIILLILLIILVILAIIYRHKIQIWWMTRRDKTKISPIVKPGVPPSSQGFGLSPGGTTRSPQRTAPYPQRPVPSSLPSRRPITSKDKEFEETLKKLKDMSK